ncbi:ArgK/MeaB family GTPase [Hansschlegelia zhihuaiae]|uniref:Methylmalonyl Co-A mutase-associated GTPase MeaB n=1 Tax=Hansschlegelia zhihuaiae TaxID=405005 RepID=A0A4Q0MHG3_9HYPH|nr:ATP/GTP-binding protein [Hansschlegelia zhihuaiae]RXF73021.1 methylmalonyl Co-A mutase-associated GTPase MeaB [Hansschlegelia zhihuaiae]
MTHAALPDLDALRGAGKPGLARALARLERAAGSEEAIRLLDAADAAPRGEVLGLTGPPGVGKSTLTGALVRAFRARGESVGVIAVDPSSTRSGGALLGDRARIPTDPEDRDVFVRSYAARDRLGGLSDLAFGAAILMRALYDRVIVETVGVGQSEADVALVGDTILLAVQPASGDALQFIKAGVMELPDVVAVTKADLGQPARRARDDLESAMSLSGAGDPGWEPPVALVSSETGEGLDALVEHLRAHSRFLGSDGRLDRRRSRQAEARLEAALKGRFGAEGLRAARPLLAGLEGGPFAREAEVSRTLSARLAGET